MFGGITTLNEGLNLNIKKEILMLLGGPLTQIIFFILIHILYENGYVSTLTYEKVSLINKLLLSFNLLPIVPLDGGKLVNNILDLIVPFDISHKITLIISILTLPLLLILDQKGLILMLFIFLIIKIIEEIGTHKYRLTKLLLERKLKNIKHKSTNYIKNIKDVKRNCNFIIEIRGRKYLERDYYKYFTFK